MRWNLAGLVFVLAACGGRPIGNLDAGGGDAGSVDGGGEADGGTLPDGAIADAGMRPDAGPPPPIGSDPAPPAEILRTGTSGYLLRGVVLTPTAVLSPGEVLVVGNMIVCVAADCSGDPAAAAATLIETHSVISPGLIDAHNHITYDFLPEWVAGTTYGNRYTWAEVPEYEDHIAPYADGRNLNERVCPAGKWAELRSIIHGTTTVMGQSFNRSCLDRLARNADHHHNLGHNHMRTNLASPREINDELAASLVEGFAAATNPVTRYAVHMQEGVSGENITLEFDSFAGRDTRMNRHMGTSLLADPDGAWSGTALLIHSISLTPAQLDEVRDTDSSVVWSPSSNLVLYGVTAPIAEILARDITVGMGPDWTVSGDDEMLSEMRTGYDYARAEAIAAITPERLWRMATHGGADAVGLGASIGRLEVGQRADITVFGRRAVDPYAAVLDSRAADVRLVLIDGAGYYGDAALEVVTSVNGDCDTIDACGTGKFLCLANTPGATTDTARATETLDDVRGQLLAILQMYGREADLLELIACE